MHHSVKSRQMTQAMKLIKKTCSRCQRKRLSIQRSQSEPCPSHAKNVGLLEYLNDLRHYQQFTTFLTECYALENLDFLKSVIIFRNILLSTLNPNEIAPKYEDEFLNDLLNLKFNYLQNSYRQYAEKINNGNIDVIISEIFDQFIYETAREQINISWNVRQKLMQSFNININHNNNNNNNTKYKYLNLFNEAILEIYDPLDSLYTMFIMDN